MPQILSHARRAPRIRRAAALIAAGAVLGWLGGSGVAGLAWLGGPLALTAIFAAGAGVGLIVGRGSARLYVLHSDPAPAATARRSPK